MRMKTLVSTMTAMGALMTALSGCGREETGADASRAETEQTNMAETVNEETGDLFADLEPATTDNEAANILLSPFDGPYNGVPHFDQWELSGLKPALEAGMEKNLAEVDAIVNNPEEPTFANTIVALEKTGDELGRVFSYWGIWSSNMSSPEFREIQGEMAPKLSEFFSKINQNEKLFARVKAVYEGDEYKTLRPDQQRLVWLTYDGFASNGARFEY